MEPKTARLYFIDALRAWAILMMLQGHFIDGLLDTTFRDPNSFVFSIWSYFRGITAPVFFTASGFIFTYLLIKNEVKGIKNKRVEKGLRRGLQLILIGYLLRLNIWGLLMGKIYSSFYLADVLHCIGLSLIGIVGVYLLTYKKRHLFPIALGAITFLLFLFEPYYKSFSVALLPSFIANYFTKANGSVFTIIPWFGYATFGAFLGLIFYRLRKLTNLYSVLTPALAGVGIFLMLYSSDAFLHVHQITGIELFNSIQLNNYLFIRMGDVLVVFSIFMLFRSLLKGQTILKIGQSTLSIYIIHYAILYGSITGLGLYRFLHHSLPPTLAISGALVFMVLCTYLSLRFEKHKEAIKLQASQSFQSIWSGTEPYLRQLYAFIRINVYRLSRFLRILRN